MNKASNNTGLVIAVVISLLFGAAITGGFLWYRRVHKQMSWREVFFMEPKDEDGSGVMLEMDD
jgi:hypothetical protein